MADDGLAGRLREVAPGVLVATSRRDSTNSVVVVGDDDRDCLLVDPAWEPDELAGLADDLDARGLVPVAGFSTHAHHDHLLWHPRFRAVPRWASAETARLAARERPALLGQLGPGWPDDLRALLSVVTALDGDRLPWRGPRAEVVLHDAHVPGHSAVWLPGVGILLAGDMLSDVELPLPDESAHNPDPLAAYASGLDALAPYAARATLVVPGHGSPGADAAVRLEADRRYLERVRAGLPADDPRVANPGMAEAHAATQALAAAASRRA